MIQTSSMLRFCIAAAVTLEIAAQPPALNAADSPMVGFLMSDYTTSARWQFDRDFFIAELKKLDPGVNVVVEDAKTDQTRQQTQAASLLTSGAKVIIDVPVDSTQAAAIVRSAHDNNPAVPVIAYERLITNSDVDTYVAFDSFEVGRQQAQYIVDHVKRGTLISIAGAHTDNNAIEYHEGAMQVLMPLVKSGAL